VSQDARLRLEAADDRTVRLAHLELPLHASESGRYEEE
jgi:hypothetical protein